MDKKIEQRFASHRQHLFVTNLFVKSCVVHLVCETLMRSVPEMRVVIDAEICPLSQKVSK